MKKVYIDIIIPSEEWLRIYTGNTRTVSALSREGLRVQFPANILQKYVTHSGVHGSFAIHFDDNGKFLSIIKL